MKLFIDTANVEEIKEMNDTGIVAGVTTNPSLIAKEGRNFHEVVKEIASIVDGPISAEVISLEAEDMIKEARELSGIHENIVVKIPMTQEGLKAVKQLSFLGIKTNVTLVFSEGQALLAAKAGAGFVSPFIGRIDDIGGDGVELVESIVKIFKQDTEINTEVIAASIRNEKHITDVASVGCDIATVPYKILKAMFKHPLTDSGIERFLSDWNKAENK